MPTDTASHAADALAALRVSGADTQKYLQGQLSADLRAARPGQLGWAGLHNPQGRALALLALAPLPGGEDWLALLPAALAEVAAAALRRFVLRARVRIEPLPAHALRAPPAGAPDAPADGVHVLRTGDGRVLWCVAGEAAAATLALPDWQAWARQDVALGLPQVYPATSGAFVAQMLNLDCIGAIGFDKGCYTGQEVIARAHYRGRVKRRMQLFAAPALPAGPGGAPAAPGDALRLADGRGAQLVRSAVQADGSVRFLAVCAWPAAAPEEGAAAAAHVDSRPLPLPYPLPD